MNILDESAPTPIGYQEIPCHIIFNVKMDFTRKARYVAGGHKTETPEAPTYASVVSCESIHIGLLMAALNDLEVMSADIAGAYLNTPCMEKVYTCCGLEFGAKYVGRIAIISKALYGLKTSAFVWREHYASTLHEHLEYQPCLADNDIWIHPTTKANGHKYYKMVFMYTDDILVISHKPKETLTMLDHHYHLKPDSIGVPTMYLGSQVKQFNLNDDPTQRCWALSAEKYVSEVIRNVKDYLEQQGQVLKVKHQVYFLLDIIQSWT